MKTTDGPGQETLRFSLPIDSLISAFHDAETASLRAGEQLDTVQMRGGDNSAIAKLHQEIRRAETAIYAALQSICSYQTTSLNEVHRKLAVWHENACAGDTAATSLSPMEQLIQSAYDDIGRILAA